MSSSGGDGGGGSVMSDGLSTGSCTLSSLVPSSLTVHRPSNGSADQSVGQRFSRSASESDISFLMQGANDWKCYYFKCIYVHACGCVRACV